MFCHTNLLFLTLALVCFKYSLVGANEEECSRFAYDHQMLDKIVKLEQKVEQMDKKLEASLESFLAILQYRKEEMQTHLNNIEDSLTSNLTTKLTNTIDSNLSELTQTEKVIAEKISIMDGYIKDHVDFPGKLEEFKKEIQETIRVPKIAFSATNPSNSAYSTAQVLMLQDTSLNEGSGYNGATGQFTAPVAGLYLFSAHACSLNQNWALFAIVVGSKEVAHSGHYDADASACSSVSTVVNVQKGEKVFLKVSHPMKLITDSLRQSSFIGVRLSS